MVSLRFTLCVLFTMSILHNAHCFAPPTSNVPLTGPTTKKLLSHTISKPVSMPHSTTALFGIPKMFRWLTDQYPNINRRLSDGLTEDKLVDCFYLDMNGIIHPCTHGNNQEEIVVLDETAMFKKIFGYVDR